MKILMIQPLGSGVPPLGLCLLGAELRQAGYVDITLVDLIKDSVADQIFSSVRTEEYLQQKLEENPDVIILTAAVATFYHANELAKKVRPYCKVLMFGGSHITIFKNKVLEKCDHIDVGVYGEADLTVGKIFKQIELGLEAGKYDFTNIPGVIWRKGGQVILNNPVPPIMDLDSIPFPDRSLLDLKSYHGAFAILTSRGCPMACTFCSRPVTGATFRGRSPKNVVDEIEMMLNKYPDVAEMVDRTIAVTDENFGVNRQRAIDICDEIIRRGIKIKLTLPNGLHVTSADLELYKKLKEAGCNFIFFGVESGNEQILRRIRKGANINLIKKAVDLCHQADINYVGGHFIIGMEDETLETARDTIKLFKEAKFDTAGFNFAVPQPGTPLWEYVEKHGRWLCNYTEIMDYSEFYFDGTKSRLVYEKLVFDTPEFPEADRRLAYKEAIKALDDKMRSDILSYKNIKRFFFSIRSGDDVTWAMRRFYSLMTKEDLRRVYEPRPKKVSKIFKLLSKIDSGAAASA